MDPQLIQFKDIQNKDSYIQCINIPGTSAATSTNYGYVLTARGIALEIIGVSEKHEVKGTDPDPATVTLDVLKVPDATAISSGASILVTPFNLKSAANTNVYKEGKLLKTTSDIRYLQIGESIALKTTGTLTAVTGVHVCIYYKPAFNGTYR
jgi:hypothetical protein